MIPILCTSDIELLSSTDARGEYILNNGIGRLTECISCEVTEALNGTAYDATITIPISALHYKDMILWSESNTGYTNGGGTIFIQPHPIATSAKYLEPFDIVEITSDDSGVATITAQHISRRLKHYYAASYSNNDGKKNLTQVLSWINSNMKPSGFSVTSDFNVVSSADYYITEPVCVFDFLLGLNSPYMDYYKRYGKGEFSFNGSSVIWNERRTQFDDTESHYIAAYGKNIISARHDINNDDYHNAGIGYFLNANEPPQTFWGGIRTMSDTRIPVVNAYDVTEQTDVHNIVNSINSAVDALLDKEQNEKTLGQVTENFVFTIEPEGSLQYAMLGDYVHVSYSPFNYEGNAKIVKATYDSINERYTSMTVGSVEKTYGQTIKPYI